MQIEMGFLMDSRTRSAWISRSHVCIGLYDEDMQRDYYQYPGKPELEDARELFEWAIPSPEDRGGLHNATTGPKVLIIGHEPKFGPRSR
jgi:hypothetical protein